ncbi:SUMF1/EgtB/PvdO family nonheme iron enzyme, partial [bacterium]|nr:SUMF1/EgtB/PvdO family nonheme iron enzyme [bacterium]
SDGRFTFTVDLAIASTPILPGSFTLQQNFPNPFNPTTILPYQLQRAAPVRLEIFNALGQQVATLIDAIQPAGYHRATWNGRDDRGRGVAAGVYIYRLTVDGLSRSRRMVMTDGKGSGALSAEPYTRDSFPRVSPSPPASRSFGLVVSGTDIETSVFPEITFDNRHLELEVTSVPGGVASKQAAVETGILGDVNNDGLANIVDALIIATYQINPSISIPNDGIIVLGDVNDDGAINIADALMVATYGIDPANSALPSGIGTEIELPNRAPVLATIGNRTIAPGGELVLELSASDPDDDPLTYTVSDQPEGAMLDGNVFTWSPTSSQMGSHRPTFSIADGRGGTATETISLSTSELIVELPNGVTIEFVWIEPGSFLMGSPESESGRDKDESPQHQVTITRGFYIGKFEITQAQWTALTGESPWVGMANVRMGSKYPSVYANWNSVGQFVQLLNELAGEKVYRLPTEAEWEYACRAGTTTRWSFGDDESMLGDYAWYDANSFNIGEKYAHQVGTKLPNPWGLYDMHGNVAEWVRSAWGNYEEDHQIDPEGGDFWPERLIRSGSFSRLTLRARSASRSKLEAIKGILPTIGSRLLRSR